MRAALLACVTIATCPAAAFALDANVTPTYYPQPLPQTSIDPRSGEQVTVTRFADGPALLKVVTREGSTWRVETDGAGGLRGVDASGVRWTFDRRARSFRSEATHEACRGSSWARLCSGA